ncbi:phosphopentomutase [Zhengella mangrovi]|uniref:Phosphopentomutase n=1 Tax=Zhengella mangrovi TaxID=1982044 RepID=A0A2G1QUD5_9HYPH|nr:phosphopentomutase [Zhengella mangrovi]PHP69069.1 phosphopentomutase [Zhengella mangrovi]
MARAFLFVLDSAGIGGAADAARFGDEGADTIGHIAERCASGDGDRADLRSGPLRLPNMVRLGLGAAAAVATGRVPPGLEGEVQGFHAAAQEISSGKDTPSGHWEMAGLPVTFDWGYFPNTDPSIPEALLAPAVAEAGLPGWLCNRHYSGTDVIDDFGPEHIATGKPIIYTSADSVIQIAAHETHFGLDALYRLCEIMRRHADAWKVGRVIARPFTGEAPGAFKRNSAKRRDYAVPPHEPTLLDRLTEAGRTVFAVGKIGDIFAHRGISDLRKASGNMAMFDAALSAMEEAQDGDFVFANFVDFDSEFGHRRDVPGYADALEQFDARLPEALSRLRPGDMLVLTADHGNDPTWRGTDHTRERVPVIGTGPGLAPAAAGLRPTFADIGETIAAHLGIAPGRHGTSFYDLIRADA